MVKHIFIHKFYKKLDIIRFGNGKGLTQWALVPLWPTIKKELSTNKKMLKTTI